MPLVGIGTPPNRRLVCTLPPVSGGRGTLAGETGVGRVPIPTRGIHCGTLYMYVLCASKNTFNEPAIFLQFITLTALKTTMTIAKCICSCIELEKLFYVHLAVLRIRDVYPGSDFLHPGSDFFPSRIRIKDFKYFTPKNGSQALGNVIRVVHPGS
jgi:hypothetical protein